MATAVGLPTNGLPPGVTVTLNKPGAAPPLPPSALAQQMRAGAADLSAQRGTMPGIIPDAPDPAQGPQGSAWDQFMGVLHRTLDTAPWAVGMRGNAPGAQPVPEPPAPNPAVLRAGQSAVETALQPQGPWGPQAEPSSPAPSPVPRAGGPTANSLNAADDAAQQAAFEAGLTKAVGTAANRSVAGFNMNAAKGNPSAIASREGPRAVEDALSNLQAPPPKPPGMGEQAGPVPDALKARAPSTVTPDELRAFLTKSGIDPANVEAAVQDHISFTGSPQPEAPPPGGPKTPAPLAAKATPPKPVSAARGGKATPKEPKPVPGPPPARAAVGETPKPIEQREISIPDDPNAKQWLRKAAGLLRSAHSLVSLSHGNAGPLARQTLSWMTRNYPEIGGRDPQVMNQVAADLLKRLSGGK